MPSPRHFFNSSGELAGYIGTCVDITERKKMEEELKTVQQRLETSSTSCRRHVCFGQRKRVIAWNRAIEKLTGIPKTAIIGQGDYLFTVPFLWRATPSLLDLLDVDDAELREKYQHVQREDGTLYAETFAPACTMGRARISG